MVRPALAVELDWRLRLPYPLRGVLSRWRGMLGMVVGVGVALGLSMTMLAVSQATSEILTGDFRKSGADLYLVTHGGTVVPILPGDQPGTIKRAAATLAEVRGLPDVGAAIGLLSWPLQREREGPKRPEAPAELFATVGVDGEPERIPGLLLLREGRFPRRGDEVMLGAKLSREKQLGLNSTVRLSQRDFTVVGIGRLRGASFSSDALAYLDLHALQQRASVGDQVNLILVETSNPTAVAARLHDLESVDSYTPTELIQQAESFAASALAIRLVFNVLTLAVAGLFVSNMLSRSVAERRAQFATLRAIGLPSRTILLTVAAEAVAVCALAALIGFGLSLGLGALLNGTLAPAYGFETLYVASPALFGLVFALALALGIVAGLLPARAATRVDPVEVLREV
jgi:putative ABC transport system permease protein